MKNVVLIVDKEEFDYKMSRERFHSVKAIFEHSNIHGFHTGPNWDNWNNSSSTKENLNKLLNGNDPDLIIIQLKDGAVKDLHELKYKKCIRYNESYDKGSVLKQISNYNIDYVVFHHYNDYIEYQTIFTRYWSKAEANLYQTILRGDNSLRKLFCIPHSVEQTIFKPKPNIKKTYDVALFGAIAGSSLGDHYPLRSRMRSLLKRMPKKYNCATIPHVGYRHSDAYTNRYAHDFADKLNSCKIAVTDSGITKSRFTKYIEIPMCGTALAADLYDDHPEDVGNLKKFLIEINMEMSDEQIIEKLSFYIDNDSERQQLINNGIKYAENFTHEKYAERFIEAFSLNQ